MSEEAIADSGAEESGIDMDAAMDSIANDIFDNPPEKTEAVEVEEEEIKEEIKEEVKEEIKANELPRSWKKDMQEKWDGVDPDTQKYFMDREAQMAKGDELRQQDATYGRTMRDTLEPYAATMEQAGVDQNELVGKLLNAQFKLAYGTQDEKTRLINQLAQEYGVTINGEAPQVDPQFKSLQDRFSYIESQLNATQKRAQQEQSEQVRMDIEAFASDPEHALFDEVSEQIVDLIKAGQDLDAAYQNAIWINPVTRQKEIDRLANEASQKSLEAKRLEAEKAKKAKAINIKGRDTTRTPTEAKGKIFEDMHDTYREIQNRN